MNQDIQEKIANATHYALASDGPHGLNLVPISVVRIVDDTVQLFNFFMRKTVENVTHAPQVAFTCWDGFAGVQLRADVVYHEAGAVFEDAAAWAKEQHPDRTLTGVLVLTPTACFDVSVSLEQPGAAIEL